MPAQHLKKLHKHLFDRLEVPAELIGQFFDDHSEGVIIIDIHTEVIYYNKAQGLIDDISPDEALGRTVMDLYRVGDNTSFPSLHCLFSRTPLRNYTCFYRTHLGKMVNSIHNIFPLFNGQELLGCICFISDYSGISSQLRPRPQALPRKGKSAGDEADEKSPKTQAGYVFEDIITANARMQTLIEEARRSADTPSPVMIFGETGTGKEMLAQSIHNYSSRRNRPFMALNCTAIPENLLEGLLFGTTKGAFTGALDKPGAMELANGGTLFLDEINSMPMGLQSKILRAVQEQRIRRVGAASETPVNLKIISATNIHPKVAVTNGDLRPDLLYRLAVVMLGIPPLRERREDIAFLIDHFLIKLNKKLGKKIEKVGPQVMSAFLRYHWPGNARELEHALEGAMNIAIGTICLELHHFNDLYAMLALGEGELSSHLSGPGRLDLAPAIEKQDAGWPSRPALPAKPSDTKGQLIEALEKSGFKASKAAELLGISPQLMYYRMKKHGLKKRFGPDGGG